jgi:hypothetical protein
MGEYRVGSSPTRGAFPSAFATELGSSGAVEVNVGFCPPAMARSRPFYLRMLTCVHCHASLLSSSTTRTAPPAFSSILIGISFADLR